MAWCQQVTSHCLSQCWPRSVSSCSYTRPQWVNLLGPSDAIWCWRSTLVQVMACCLTAPSHYLNQYNVLYLIIIIKPEVWIINHCLGLGHETMVCAVCLTMFLLTHYQWAPLAFAWGQFHRSCDSYRYHSLQRVWRLSIQTHCYISQRPMN